jgi:hypothetical protein
MQDDLAAVSQAQPGAERVTVSPHCDKIRRRLPQKQKLRLNPRQWL